MKLKGPHLADVAEIQEAVTDELKVQIEEFLAAFQKLYDRAKVCIYASGAYFELKKGMYLPHVSSIFKKSRPQNFWTALCKTAVCRHFLPCRTANVTYFHRKIQLSVFSACPVDSSSQLIRTSGVLLYFINPEGVTVVLNKCLERNGSFLFKKDCGVPNTYGTPQVHPMYT